MNKQNFVLLIILILIFLGIIISGFYYSIPILWIGGFVLLAVTYLYLTSSKACVKSLIRVAKSYEGEDKEKRAYYLLSDKFRKSLKFDLFKDFKPSDIENILLSSRNDIATSFALTLKDGRKYIIQAIKRSSMVDGKNIFTWVVDDILGHEFDKSYKEIYGEESKE